MIELNLPFPPSVNHYWKHKVVGRHVQTYLGKAAVAYKLAVADVVYGALIEKLSGRLQVTIYAHVPDMRKRDLDNLHKATLDDANSVRGLV